MSERLDCAIVGAGPAGLSAAVNLHQRGKTVRVFGHGTGMLSRAQQVDNHLGMHGLTGPQMQASFEKHAAELGIVPEQIKVSNIMPFDGYFMLNLNGDILEASSVVLACGVVRANPIPGEEDFQQGVSVCATCDGMFYRGKKVLVWGLAEDAPAEANFLARIGCEVTYIAGKRPDELDPAIPFVQGGLQKIGGEGKVEYGEVAGQKLPCDGVFLLRQAVAPSTLLPGLEVENGTVVVDRNMATNIPGVFAAGDITGAPLQISKAVGEGLVAALNCAAWLDKQA